MRTRPQPLAALALLFAGTAWAGPLDGDKTVHLHGRDGTKVAIGQVRFTPAAGGRTTVQVRMDPERLKDFFLSMREFKCVEAPAEVQCHVPYPYKNPGTVTPQDLGWLEHQLLFFYKQPTDFGAKLWNGLYYRLALNDQGLTGTPQAVDLNAIGAPPARLDVPPYGPAERSDLPPDARWFYRLTID